MIKGDLKEDSISVTLPKNDLMNSESKDFSREGIFLQEILSDFLELKREMVTLKREVSENKLLIAQLEKKKDSYGKEVANRVSSMLSLINDYGGVMTSKETKKIMGLSKDEFYRTLQCAKNDNLIELLPNRRDRRSYLIKLKGDQSDL